MTELYRHYDKDDNLLYVGISISTIARLTQHRANKKWFKDITSIKIERFDEREDACKAELKAIKDEKPLHNKMGVTEPYVRSNKKDSEPFLSKQHLQYWVNEKWRNAWNDWNKKNETRMAFDKYMDMQITLKIASV